jgi:plastocyanin
MLRLAAALAVILLILSTTSASAATATVKMSNYAFTAKNLTVTLGNSVKWKNVTAGKTHSATPTNNWSWSGVTVNHGATSYAVSPTQAGTFPYFCSFHPTKMKGSIKVPMTVTPLAGTVGQFFALTLGTVSASGVLVHQVEIRQDGGPWVLRVTTNAPSTQIQFTSAGTWDLRTRLRYQLGGATSEWSPLSTVLVF